jgi:hypothetical protein
MSEILQTYGVEDPAPHSDRVRADLLFAALIAAPGAWLLELLINYGLAAQACFPREHLRTLPSAWSWLRSGVIAVDVVALAITIVATVISISIWRRTNEEASGDHAQLVHSGEGRTRFLAIWGIWSGAWFIIQIAFNTISSIGVPACAS